MYAHHENYCQKYFFIDCDEILFHMNYLIGSAINKLLN